MNVQAIVVSQYNAALEMLKGAVVEKCPDALWDSSSKTKFLGYRLSRPVLHTPLPAGFREGVQGLGETSTGV